MKRLGEGVSVTDWNIPYIAKTGFNVANVCKEVMKDLGTSNWPYYDEDAFFTRIKVRSQEPICFSGRGFQYLMFPPRNTPITRVQDGGVYETFKEPAIILHYFGGGYLGEDNFEAFEEGANKLAELITDFTKLQIRNPRFYIFDPIEYAQGVCRRDEVMGPSNLNALT